MNWSSLAKVAVVNAVLTLFIYLIFQDVSSRNVYAEELRFAPSTSYSIFSHVLTLAGKGTTLSSPPTLDWPQLLAFALIVFDALFLIGLMRSRKNLVGQAGQLKE